MQDGIKVSMTVQKLMVNQHVQLSVLGIMPLAPYWLRPRVSKLLQQGTGPVSIRPCGGPDYILKKKTMNKFLCPTNNPEMHFK